MKLKLHAVLEADDGPEFDINIGGVLDTRLVVNPIKDAFGIPVKYLCACIHIYIEYFVLVINGILKSKLT